MRNGTTFISENNNYCKTTMLLLMNRKNRPVPQNNCVCVCVCMVGGGKTTVMCIAIPAIEYLRNEYK